MFTTTITPRFGDADMLGHINNTALALWFETARTPLFRIFDPELTLTPKSWPLIMAHSEYDFVAELFMQYPVEVKSWISRIGKKSFTVYHEAWQEGRLGVTGNVVIVHYDFINHESTPLPDDKKRILQEHFRVDIAKTPA